jgi:putative transcriptional regulator
MDSLARMAERSILAGFRRSGSTFRHIAVSAPLEQKEKMESRLDKAQAPRYSVLESWLYMNHIITNQIKELRAAHGWTQEQLARLAGVSRQSINSIERNRYVPSLELALVFARLFDCSTDQIFQLENEK